MDVGKEIKFVHLASRFLTLSMLDNHALEGSSQPSGFCPHDGQFVSLL
jgi:hypothetical protein